MYVCVYIYIYVHVSLSLSIYIYTHTRDLCIGGTVRDSNFRSTTTTATTGDCMGCAPLDGIVMITTNH